MPLILRAAMVLLAMLVAGAARADIVLDRIPAVPAMSDRQGRAILQAESERLRQWRRGIGRTGQIIDTDCARVRRGSAEAASCMARINALTGEGRAFNDAVRALRKRIDGATRGNGTLPRSAWLVRDRAQVAGGTDTALRAANEKTAYVLLALEFGQGDWQRSLGFLRDLLALGPGPRDAEIREALAYVEGMYRGWLATARLSNLHYRQGVRRWVAGDYAAATRAFAQAARDDPDDLKIYTTFAHAVGRQHESADCLRRKVCVSGNLPRWASQFGPSHRAALDAMRLTARGPRATAAARRVLTYLEGMAVYADQPDPEKRPGARTPAAQALADRAIRRVAANDVAGAAVLYAKAWAASDGDRALLFLAHYNEGILAARGRVAPNPLDRAIEDETFRDLYRSLLDDRLPALEKRRGEGPGFAARTLSRLRAALRKVAQNSPFFGPDPRPSR